VRRAGLRAPVSNLDGRAAGSAAVSGRAGGGHDSAGAAGAPIRAAALWGGVWAGAYRLRPADV
nr:hypothetical protein [Tanacetum cinerariifolium]